MENNNEQTTQQVAQQESLKENRVGIGRNLSYHNHDGINSPKIPARYTVPSFNFTTAQLTTYLAGPANEGDEFNVYISTTGETRKYIRSNSAWVKIGTSIVSAPNYATGYTASAGNTTDTLSPGFQPKLIKITAYASSSSPADDVGFSIGHWSASGQQCISRYGVRSRIYTSNVARCYDDTATNGEVGVLGNVTSTTFDIVWAQAGSGSVTYLWEAFG